MSGEGSLPGLQVAVFSLYPHKVESRKRESKLCHIFADKDTNLIQGGLLSRPNYLPKALPPKYPPIVS